MWIGGRRAWRRERVGKGQMGSALIGWLRISCFLTQGLSGYSREPTFIFQKVPGRIFFLDLSKLITLAAALLVSTPFVRNQNKGPQGTATDDMRVRRAYHIRVHGAYVALGNFTSLFAARIRRLCTSP